MEHVFFLLLVLSTSLCAGNDGDLWTGTGLAVCQPNTCALLSEVAAMKEKQAAMAQAQTVLQQNFDTMMQKMAAVEAGLQYYKSQAEELGKINQAQAELLSNITSARASQCAFTAGLGSPAGPSAQDTALKYQRVMTNVGNCYNSATGVFTARVPGTYYFRYTMYNNNAGRPNTVVSLMKNTYRMVTTWDTADGDVHDSASNAAVLQLDAGDSVFVQLRAHRVVYDDGNYYNTFSGFLLFA